MYQLKLLFFLILFFTAVPHTVLLAEEHNVTPLHFEEQKIEEYKKDSDFDYHEEKSESNIFQRLKDWFVSVLEYFFKNLLGIDIAQGIVVLLLKIMFYSFLAFILFIIIKMFLKVKLNSIVSTKSNLGTVNFYEDEHIIQNEDISALINKAISNENYRLAVRYYYLLILKSLTEKQLISWEIQKTNDDYSKEIGVPDLRTPFDKLTTLYDFVWYGNFDVELSRFSKIENDFQQFNNKLNGFK